MRGEYRLSCGRVGGKEKFMSHVMQGIVHGKTIELAEEIGVGDGEQVEVSVRVVSKRRSWGEGLQRCAGALAREWTEEDDRILEEIHQERKRDSRGEIPG
jgi:hypothetical protein